MTRLRGVLSRFIGLYAIVTVGCRDGGPNNTPATITISPAPIEGLTLTSGSSLNLAAIVMNSDGAVISGQTPAWTSSDNTVATITSSGALATLRTGQAIITASIGSVTSTPMIVHVTPGKPSRLVVRTQPAGGASASVLSTQPVVEVQDAAGNVTSATTIVTATIGTGGGTITGSTASTTAGVATFTSLTITGIIGDRTLIFSASGVTPVTSIGVALGPGIPTQLVVRTQPTGAVSGTPFSPQPVVELRDSAGNLATTSNATVTAGIGDGGGALTNNTAVASKGVASFTLLTLAGFSGDHTLTFRASGVPTIISAGFVLTGG